MTRKFDFNYNYFNEPNQAVAYFAGFCMADGNLYIGKRSGDTPELRIQIHKKDICILEEFCDSIKLDRAAIKHYKVNTTSGQISEQVRVSLMHANLPSSLYAWGIVPNKTYNFIRPTLASECVVPYLVGLIDGDGCIYNRYVGNYLKTGLVITGNPMAMQWVADVIGRLGYSKTINVSPAHGNYAKRVELNSTKEIVDVLLNNANFPHDLALKRKWAGLLSYHK